MKKSDLRSGMVCQHRNGKFSIVVLNSYENGEYSDNFVFASNNRSNLTSFNNNFQWASCLDYSRKLNSKDPLDIIAIYQPRNTCEGFIILEKHYSQINTSRWQLLWKEQEEATEMTLSEICKALGKSIKIIEG